MLQKTAAIWDPSGNDLGMRVYGPIQEWDDDLGDFKLTRWYGDRSVTEQWRSWLFEREWKTIAGNPVAVYVDQTDRVAAGEDVGGATPAQNDAQCALLAQGLTQGVRDWPIWGPWIDVQHAASLNVLDPPNATARPSAWVGAGGTTPGGTNGDTWTVATGSTAPTVTRNLATRYWLRMARLRARQKDPTYQNPDWPIMLRRQRPDETYLTWGDDPAWWSNVPNEDVWNWSNYSYALLHITAPASGAITLTLRCKSVAVSDPCYTCYEHRFGAEGEWDYSTNEFEIAYTFRVSSGANVVLLDLCRSNSHLVPYGANCLQHVESIEFALPPNATGGPEAWTITGLDLVEDPGEGARAKPAVTCYWHNKRSWDWRHMADCLGIGANVNGLAVLQNIPYGYGALRSEQGLMNMQYRQHCPDSELSDELSYLKTGDRMVQEWDWQEGFTVTWQDPQDAEDNKDADGVYADSVLYATDLQHQLQSATSGCLYAGFYAFAYGAQYDIYYSVYPEGKLTGLAFKEDYTDRERGASAAVPHFKRPDTGGDWSSLGLLDTDDNGAFRSDPQKEKGWVYRIGLAGASLPVVNREYTYTGGYFVGGRWLRWEWDYPFPGYYRNHEHLHMFTCEEFGQPGEHYIGTLMPAARWVKWYKQGPAGISGATGCFKWDRDNVGNCMGGYHHGDGRKWAPRYDKTV